MDCKLCSRKFSNGKALGGHMRSHFATLALPPKTPQRQEISEPLADLASSSDERESSGEKSSLASGLYGLREKPRKSVRLVDPNFCDSVVDRQSESVSTRSRGKRGKETMSREEDDQELTKRMKAPLMHELEKEEDVASFLVLLSRDFWRDSDELQMRERIFKCEDCDRGFKSSQGLGSHRANHHQNKIRKPLHDAICDNEMRKIENHECEYCGKVFRSGKALGGHKRVHLQASKVGTSMVEDLSAIELNLSPEIEAEDDEFCSY